MGPKKRGTRASKRVAEAEAAAEAAEAVEAVEESETKETEEMETESSKEESETDNKESGAEEEPPAKKSKVEEVNASSKEAEDNNGTTKDEEENNISDKAEDKESKSEEKSSKSEEKSSNSEEKSSKPEERSSKSEKSAKPEEKEKEKAENGEDTKAVEGEKGDEEEKKAEDTYCGEKIDPGMKEELDRFWKAVKDDPTDFTGWTYLLQFVDSKNVRGAGREAFDAFLKRYPYCYGYWKKYADFERRNGSVEKSREVFKRGFEAIPLSVDLWLHYISHVKSSDQKDDLPFIREQYNRAIKACGKEFRSDKLWDSFLKFETDNKNLKEAYSIYKRLLRVPTMGVDGGKQFDKFRDFIKSSHPKELMGTEEFLSLRKEILDVLKEDKVPGSEDDGKTEEKVPGEEGSEVASDEETLAMKERLIFSMKKIFKQTEAVFNERYKYEGQIKRPYFHVKPLERSQLKAWNDYLQFMQDGLKSDSKTKRAETVTIEDVEMLYERCLIACSLYEEFWLSYINWLESLEGDHVDQLRRVFKRACTSHLPNKIDIHLRWAAFEEIQKNFDKAAEILENMEKVHPELTSIKLRRVNLERRRGDDDKAVLLYEACIKSAQDDSLMADCSIKYARYLRLHLHDTDKAKEVILKAIEQHPKNVKLYLQMLDILLHSLPLDVEEVSQFLDRAAAQDFKPIHKQLFSQRKVEFLEDFGIDMQALKEAHEAHVKLSKEMKEKMGQEYGQGDPWYSEQKGESISTLDSTRGSADRNGSQSYAPVANSASYQAQHTMAYQSNAGRYGTYPTQYQQYGASYASTGYGGY